MADRTAPDQLLGERVGARFVIERLIGSGPLSSSFRARDELLQRRVTVKLFHPQHADDVAVVDSQLELAKAVARLSHPNIVTVIDRGEHEGMPFVVLEHVRGENLHERIERFAPLRIVEVVGYGTSIARALAYAHAQGVVHGNLRPQNVLISEDREVKLVDFGGGSYVAALTGDAYRAPEAADDPPNAESRPEHDIYALGVLLFVALTEQVPPIGIDASRVQLLRPDVSPRLGGLIARALHVDPGERRASMHEVASELAAVRPPAADLTEPRSGARGAGVAASSSSPPPAAPGATAPLDALGSRSRDRRKPRARRQLRARLVAWSMVLVPLALLALIATMVLGDLGGNPTVRSNDKPSSRKGAQHKVKIVGARAFDPVGGDGEHDLEAKFVFDDDTATVWPTSEYDSADITILKPGVGLFVSLAEPVAASSIRIRTELPGWIVTIYAADDPAAQLDGWTRVSEPVEAAIRRDVKVDTDGATYDHYLLWITRLTLDQEGQKHKAEIAELQVFIRDD